MRHINNTKAISEMFHDIGDSSHFSADVSINDNFIGRHTGRIDLYDANSPGKIVMEDMDSEKFYTSFDGKFQDFQYDNYMMTITGTGNKGAMNGSYKFVLSNIKGEQLWENY